MPGLLEQAPDRNALATVYGDQTRALTWVRDPNED